MGSGLTRRPSLSAPELLEASHAVVEFECGTASLDDWLRRRALANQASGAARTFVVCEGRRVVAYYALAPGAVTLATATGRFRRNMPEPIPVVLLGWLAVDQRYQGQGLGRALFRDAALRVAAAADLIGVRGMLVHAISAEAKAFYLALGFAVSPLEAMTLMVSLAEVRSALGGDL